MPDVLDAVEVLGRRGSWCIGYFRYEAAATFEPTAAVHAPDAGRYVVTVSVDQVKFREPICMGELVTFLSSVNHTGTSSMEIGI